MRRCARAFAFISGGSADPFCSRTKLGFCGVCFHDASASTLRFLRNELANIALELSGVGSADK